MLRKLFAGMALAVVGSLLASLTALGYEEGQHGNVLFADDSTHRSATCKYTVDSADPSTYWISRITVTPPSVWWPDTNGTRTTQHGTVGWRFFVERDNGGPGLYMVAKSPLQKKVAYEDQLAPYGSATKAPFTKMTVAFNGKKYGMGSSWAVLVRVNWYRPDGTVMGYVTQRLAFYREKLPSGTAIPVEPECSASIQIA